MNRSDSRKGEALHSSSLSRLLRYMLRYRLRVSLGVAFSLLASIANLFSITAFIPVFDSLGEAEHIQIFNVGNEEREVYQKYTGGEPVRFYEKLSAEWTGLRLQANAMTEGYTPREVILMISAAILPLYFLKLLSVTLGIFFIGTAGLLAVRDIREDLYIKMNLLGMDYFYREKTGMIMSRIINDAELIGRSLSTEFSESVTNVFYIVTHILLLALIDWKMLLATLLLVPIVSMPMGKIARKIRSITNHQQEWLAQMGGHVQEIISGIRVIRAFSMERFEKTRFKKINENLYRNTFDQHYIYQVGPAVTEFLATAIVLGFLTWGAYSIAGGELRRGLFFAFFVTLVFIMRPLKQISVMTNLYHTAVAAAERIFQILDLPPGSEEDPDPRPFKTVHKNIAFKHVGFRYPSSDHAALSDIDLEVKAGTTIAFVGSSGAGKSTLMDLIPRFYDVTEGSLEIDGLDIRRYNLKQLRRNIGVVTQNIFLFNATILENISYGRDDFSYEQILEAARAANAHEFIELLPQGYQTPVGERGVMLSGGQRQRIAIARSLLHDPPILIFDEATSNLDNESEMLIQQAMERLSKGRTVFIIAHRLSTIYRADTIAVMESGRIVEMGNHTELLEKESRYKKLYELQFSR